MSARLPNAASRNHSTLSHQSESTPHSHHHHEPFFAQDVPPTNRESHSIIDAYNQEHSYAAPAAGPAPNRARPKTAKTPTSHSNQPQERRVQSAAPTQTRTFNRPKISSAPITRISREDLDRLSKPVIHVEPPELPKPKPTPVSKLPPAAPGTEHKRYSSVYPCANRLLAKRWDDAARRRHQDKLATMKTYIDSKPPQVQGHLKEKSKKIHMEDQKLTKIERENHILLARMVRQMSAVQGFTGLDADNKVKVTAAKPTPSARKKKELLEQIDESNQMLMQRVEARQPHYRQQVWDEERRTNLSYLQRITRFPEGYQHVLAKEGVPPPLKTRLQIRWNRSEVLRQKWAIESKANLDEFGNPIVRAASPTKSSSSDDEHEEHATAEVHMTKSEQLRREYIQAMKDGDIRQWRARHALYTKDPLDISLEPHSPANGCSSEDEAKAHPKFKIRMNRAQKLRKEEHEARMKEHDKIKVPVYFSNVEARIDFGQDSIRQVKLNESTERDKEIQFATTTVDESDFEPEVMASTDLEAADETRASWQEVFHGVSLRSGYMLPDGFPVSVGVCWASSGDDDYSIERWEVLNRVLPRVKSKGNQFGMEFILRDFKWGVPKNLTDNHTHFDLQLQEMENYLTSSIGIHFLCFISNKRGPPASLPTFLTARLYAALMESISQLDSTQSASLVQQWYKLDENRDPPGYVLLPISAVIVDFGADIKTKAFRVAKDEWKAVKANLLNLLADTARAVLLKEEWLDEDAEALKMLGNSKIEMEAMKAIQGPTDDAIIIFRDCDWQTTRNISEIGPFLDWTSECEPDEVAASQILELRTKLLKWIPESNQVIDEVYFSPGGGLKLTDPDVKRYITNMTDTISDLLENSLQRAADRLTIDPIREEVLYHAKLFAASISNFTGKSRMVNKVSAFFQRRYRYSIPPFLVQGPLGQSATNLLCKGFQKFLNEAITAPLGNQTSACSAAPIAILRFIGSSPDSSNAITLLRSICRQLKRVVQNCNVGSTQSGDNPPCSSPIFDPDYLPGDFSSLHANFLELLAFATPERPIFLLLLNIDKLNSDEFGCGLEWLSIENGVPNVYIALSASQESSAILENLKVKTERAQQILLQLKKEIFGDLTLSIEMIDIPQCQVELNRWQKLDGLKIVQLQRRSLLFAATAVSSNGFSTTPWILRAHYLHVRKLHSWESYNPTIISNLKDAELHLVNCFFDSAEKLHGKTVLARLARLLILVRDGLSESALEDLLSLDPDILSESIASQIECSNITPLTPLIPIPRISSVAIVYLLNTLIKDYELVIRGRGYERGPNLLKWTSETVRDVAKSRYLGDPKIVQAAFEDIAAYFNNDWTNPERRLKEQDCINIYLKGIGSSGENWKGALKPQRLLPRHVNSWSHYDGVYHNLRKLRVLPRALLFAQRYRDLRRLLEDFEFVEALVDTTGVAGLIKELVWLVKEGRKQSPAMPSDCVIVFKHWILFFRHRMTWMTRFETCKSMRPPGLWLQEFNNFPANTNAVFADPIRVKIEDDVDQLMLSRGGRIEYEPTWKPDNEVYDPIQFYHTNVQCCSVSIDGKLIASGASDGSIKIWNTATGEEVMIFNHITTNDSAVRMDKLSPESGIRHPTKNGITFVCFSSERQPMQLVSCAHELDQEPSIKLWNLRNMSTPPKVMVGGHSVGASIVRCEYLPPENRRLMSVGSDFNIVLWEVARCKIIRVFTTPMMDFDFSIASTTGFQQKSATSSKKKRLHVSGYSQVASSVSQTGLFAYGSTTLTICDDHWREVMTKEINVAVDKERILKWHRITAITFSSDGTLVYVASAVAPDDAQILAVERQQAIEKLCEEGGAKSMFTSNNALLSIGHPNRIMSSANMARKASMAMLTDLKRSSSFNASSFNTAAVKTEVDLKRAKQTVIRTWNIETGHLKLLFYIEDYITSIALSHNNNYLLTSGSKGTVSGWDASKGTLEFIREGHTASVAQIVPLPAISRKRRDEDDALFYTYGGQFNMSVSRSLGSLSGTTASPIQFISLGLDNKFLLWTIEHENVFPGVSPITHCCVNAASDYMVTVGGAPVTGTGRPASLIRVWELVAATNRVKFEISAEVCHVSFIPGEELKILAGCKNGLARIYRAKTGEVLHEFWVDAENAMSESTLGYKMEWPFSATGVTVLSYALHPDGKHLAVAVAGQERVASPAGTLTNARIDAIANTQSMRQSGKPASKVYTKEDSADRVLRDVIKLTFWDMDGNCMIIMHPFDFQVFTEFSDVLMVSGPLGMRPNPHRKSSFVLNWSQDGRCLFASDDCEILKEGTIEFRGKNVYETMQATTMWKKGNAPTLLSYEAPLGTQNASSRDSTAGRDAQQEKSEDRYGANLDVSMATAVHSIIQKKMEHTCFAYGDGAICLRTVDLERSGQEVRWFLGHRVFGTEGGDVVGCAFVPGVESRSSSNLLQKHNKLSGVVVSARRNGTVVIQDVVSREICAVFHAGTPVYAMAVVPSSYKLNSLKFIICKSDGSMSMLRYYS
ncbi:hypothetical protein CcCBS67573_g03956 [Chytriomyces confervae]|uniref:Uncharacterized protein n=1 Tax=Chytriomyces confervae TaxID=246404 RepID=A0A507FEW1_9FUNG|nr:hypothetical protein CcCBS67573_g03956 [Chytriomyces confervae]